MKQLEWYTMVRDVLYFPTHSFVNLYTTRRKRNKVNRTADSKRNDSNYATYGEQGRRSKEFVVP